MNPKPAKLNVALVLLLASVLPTLQAQVAPQSPIPAADSKKVALEPAKEKESKSEDDEVVQFSPFVVSGENTQRYLASSTLAGTRVRTNLADIGASVSVVTKEFLQDTGSKDALGLLVYTTSTEVGGLGGNFAGVGNGSALDETSKLRAPNTNTRVRGLAAADNTRDYFSSDVPWDSYNISHVDISRGANSILFGIGSPAGIFNASTNRAEFKDANKLEWTMGQYGSQRGVVDFNKVLLPKELAIRLEALKDNSYYRQEPAYKQDERVYAALRYDPKFLDRNGMQTSLNVNFEKGSIHSNNPRMLPPVDRLTPWLTSMNKATFDGHFGAPASGTPAFQPWLASEGLFGGPRVFFPDASSSTQSPSYAIEFGTTYYFGLGANGQVDHNILGPTMYQVGHQDPLVGFRIGTYPQYALAAKLPFSATLNPYKNIYIKDPTIFNFYDNLLDGPNKSEERHFDVATADLSQTFWNNRLGLQGVWSLEHYSDGQIASLSGGAAQDVALTVDLNQFLPDGSANPNVGRPMVDSRSGGGNINTSKRKNSRYTAFADLKANDFLRESWLTKILGRHVLTAAYTVDQRDQENRSFPRFVMDNSYQALTGGAYIGSSTLPEAAFQSYLGPSLAGATTAARANIPNLQARQLPTAATLKYWDSHWAKPINPATPGYVNPGAPWTAFDGSASTQSENPANYVGWSTVNTGVLAADNNNYTAMTTNALKSRLNVKSSVFVWQGFLFDGDIIPTWSVRKDTVASYSVRPPRNANFTYNLTSPSYVFPAVPNSTSEGTIHSKSLVVHTPKQLRKRLWGQTDLAFTYNDSSNYQVLAGRIDLYGNPVPAPTGKTKDWGFVLSTWNDRLRFKVTHFKTTIENDTSALPNIFWIGYLQYAVESNAQNFKLGLSGDPQYSIANSGYRFNFEPQPGVSAADTRVIQQQAVDAALAASPGAQFYKNWSIDPTKSSDWLTPNLSGFVQPPGITATQTSESKGMEYELNFQPNKNWALTANASHVTAKYTSIADNFQTYVNNFNTLMQGPAGVLPMYYSGSPWGVLWGRNAALSIGTYWVQYFYSGYQLTMAQQGTNLAEIRPWRYNLATTYQLGDYVKGLYVGGAYRWEDKVAIGYPVYHNTTTNSDTFDVAHPYYGPKETHADLWVGYERKLMRGINWRVQLNVRDIGRKAHLVPITVQPDGTPAGVRIMDGQFVQVTNTFTF